MQVGNLNVTGDQLTVEVMFDKTKPNSGSQIYSADLVSKHFDSGHASYALRPNSAEVTTSNGNFETPKICNCKLNKTYHVAMVYNGKELKFYRNGFLMSSVACTGNIADSNFLTDIGFFSKKTLQTNSNFIGYVNEVRIWNVARSEYDLRKYMRQSLPNATSQNGLLAYYVFDDLKNKQGNPQWDASVIGVAKINQTNPACSTFATDSCGTLICTLKAAFTHSVSVCDAKTIHFYDTTINADSTWWDFGNGQKGYTTKDTIIEYNNYGKYTAHLYAKTNYGCDDTATEIIDADVLKDNVVVTNDTFICAGNSIQLNAIKGLSYCWSPPTGLSDSSIQNPIAKPTSTTTYYLNILKDSSQNVTQDSIIITVLPLPNVNAENDTSICNGSSVQLNATGAATYSWLPSTGLSNANIENPVSSPDSTIMYTVKGTDLDGCSNFDSIKIIVNPAPQFSVAPLDTSICFGDSVLLTASGGDSYQWSPITGLFNTSSAVVKASPTNDITYSVAITNSICKTTKALSANINVHKLPVVSITKSNDIDCLNYESHLNATGGVSYSWSPSAYISDINISNPVVDPPTDTKFFVIAIDNNRCKNQDSILVHSTLSNVEAAKFEVANAFTPNDDGVNDCFSVHYWGAADAFEMLIYNRWGQIVFHTKNIHDCWDGRCKGILQPIGTYVYVITALTKCSNGVLHKKGTFLLMR